MKSSMPTTEGLIYEINHWTPSKSTCPNVVCEPMLELASILEQSGDFQVQLESLNSVPLYCAQIAPNASGALIPGVVGET
jgi:hypothetical protein